MDISKCDEIYIYPFIAQIIISPFTYVLDLTIH